MRSDSYTEAQWKTHLSDIEVLSDIVNQAFPLLLSRACVNNSLSISSIVSQCGLIGVLDYMHPQETPPPTRIDSGRRIDFIF
jgi:hypothetical protein